MGYQKAAHHRGPHQVEAKAITDAAYANPATRCWRCERTLTEVREQTNPAATWDAGHTAGPGSPKLAECSPCNRADGARTTNRRRSQPRRSRTW